MKYYIYISDDKLDMIYTQIPRTLWQRFAAELEVNLNLIKASLKVSEKKLNKFICLDEVVKYIEDNNEVGTVDCPNVYFKGALSMKYMTIAGIAFRGAIPDKESYLCLGGSVEHLIGTSLRKMEHEEFFLGSALDSILLVLGKNLNEAGVKVVDSEFLNQRMDFSAASYIQLTIDMMQDRKNIPARRYEFLAKRLYNHEYLGTKTLLGTPIYVALAD